MSAIAGRRCTIRLQRAAGVWSLVSEPRPRPGMRSRLTLWPAKARSAGSSVTEAAITTSTARLVESATPCR